MIGDVVNRFIECAQEVLQAETGGPISIGPVSVQNTPRTGQHITALVGIAGGVEGVMMFGLSEPAARVLVSRMMGQDIEGSDELVQSGIAEVGNVIAGNAVTSVSQGGYSCTISPPTLIIGSGTIISTGAIRRLIIPLTTSCGFMEMQLALKLNGKH